MLARLGCRGILKISREPAPREKPTTKDRRPTTAFLLPLNRARRLRGDVVHNAVDAVYLVHDPVRDRLEHLMRQRHPIGCHTIFGMHGANGASVSVRALVAH